MASSSNPKDYPYLRDERLWNVTECNSALVRHFIMRKRVEGIRLSSVDIYVATLLKIMREVGIDDFSKVTKDELMGALLRIEGRSADRTINLVLTVTRMFLSEYYSKDEIDKMIPMWRKKVTNELESSDYISEGDVLKMRDYAESKGYVRDMALIMILYGTGARISELLDCNIGDVEIKQTNGVLSVDGKTGKRKIPFVIGLPEMITWLNSHPKRNDKSAPLFVTYNTRGNDVKRLTKSTVEKYFKRMKDIGVIDKDVKCNPHAFRHLSATTMVKKLSPKEMNKYYGWTSNSNTVMTYLHTSDEDLERSLLGANGVVVEDKVEGIGMFTQCPSCNAILPSGAVQCPKCRMILDPVLAVKYNDVVKDLKDKEVIKEFTKDE